MSIHKSEPTLRIRAAHQWKKRQRLWYLHKIYTIINSSINILHDMELTRLARVSDRAYHQIGNHFFKQDFVYCSCLVLSFFFSLKCEAFSALKNLLSISGGVWKLQKLLWRALWPLQLFSMPLHSYFVETTWWLSSGYQLPQILATNKGSGTKMKIQGSVSPTSSAKQACTYLGRSAQDPFHGVPQGAHTRCNPRFPKLSLHARLQDFLASEWSSQGLKPHAATKTRSFPNSPIRPPL